MRLVQFAHGAWVWCMVTVVLGCGGASEDEGAAANNDIRQVRLMSHYDSVLSIGPEGAIQEYPYDARGPGSFGTMRAVSQGRADLVFPAESMYVTDLYFIPGVPVYVDIVPRDMVGTIDFCTGHVDLSYDALFRPMVFGRPQEPLSVVTTLTTGTSSGLFRQVTGRPLDERGDLRLVSVAVVPETGNPFINKALSLPTDAVSELEQHLDFPEGRLRCPGHHEEGTARKVHMAVGKDGRLSISFLGSFPEFAYDGKGSDGIGLLGPVVDGRS